MTPSQTIYRVIQQLRELFMNGGELKGYDAWDGLFGCVQALQRVAEELEAQPPQKQEEGDKEWQN